MLKSKLARRCFEMSIVPKGEKGLWSTKKDMRWKNYVSSNIQIAGVPERKPGEHWGITNIKINFNAQYGEKIQQYCVIIIKPDKTTT